MVLSPRKVDSRRKPPAKIASQQAAAIPVFPGAGLARSTRCTAMIV